MDFFFTLVDDSLRTKGSRDPLGLEFIWSGVGRQLIGNLTTVTANLDNFIMTLLGFHVCGDHGREQERWVLFQRFEQATGHARGPGAGVLGDRRVRAAVDTWPRLLGESRDAQLLEDQQRAGLWGLYTSALVATGLANRERQLTPRGKELAELFLGGTGWQVALREVLDVRVTRLDRGQLEPVVAWTRAVLGCAQGRRDLAAVLLGGGAVTRGAAFQQELYRVAGDFLRQCSSAGRPDPSARELLWHVYQASPASPALREYAGRMLKMDEVLALAGVVFGWLLGRHGDSLAVVSARLAGSLASWPKTSLDVPAFPEINDDLWQRRRDSLQEFCACIRAEDWGKALETLLDYHRTVMARRGGAPWCYPEGGLLKVVAGDGGGVLPSADELKKDFEAWMRAHATGFFIPSFLSVLMQASAVEPEAP